MSQQQSIKNFSIKYALGSFAATYISGIVHPLDIIKTRFQSHDGQSQANNLVPKYRGIWHGIKTIFKQQGLMGLYKGFHVSIFSQAMASAVFFWVYQVQKNRYCSKGEDVMNAVLYSSVEAGIVGATLTQPFWVVRTRMVLNTSKNISQWRNLVSICQQIWRQDRMRGYLKGYGLSLVLSFSGVVQMYIYEAIQKLYKAIDVPQSGMMQRNFVCGAVCKGAVVLLSYPITTLRTRIQQNQYIHDSRTKKYNGVWDVTKQTMRQQGIRGFYKGMNANLLKGVLQKGIYFYFYQLFKKAFIQESTRQQLQRQ